MCDTLECEFDTPFENLTFQERKAHSRILKKITSYYFEDDEHPHFASIFQLQKGPIRDFELNCVEGEDVTFYHEKTEAVQEEKISSINAYLSGNGPCAGNVVIVNNAYKRIQLKHEIAKAAIYSTTLMNNVLLHEESNQRRFILGKSKQRILLTLDKQISKLQTLRDPNEEKILKLQKAREEYSKAMTCAVYYIINVPFPGGHLSCLIEVDGVFYSLGFGYSGQEKQDSIGNKILEKVVSKISKLHWSLKGSAYSYDWLVQVEKFQHIVHIGLFEKKHFDKLKDVSQSVTELMIRPNRDKTGNYLGTCSNMFQLDSQYAYCSFSTSKMKRRNCTSWLQHIFSDEIECAFTASSEATVKEKAAATVNVPLGIVHPDSCRSKAHENSHENSKDPKKEFDKELKNLLLSLQIKNNGNNVFQDLQLFLKTKSLLKRISAKS